MKTNEIKDHVLIVNHDFLLDLMKDFASPILQEKGYGLYTENLVQNAIDRMKKGDIGCLVTGGRLDGRTNDGKHIDGVNMAQRAIHEYGISHNNVVIHTGDADTYKALAGEHGLNIKVFGMPDGTKELIQYLKHTLPNLRR